MRVTGTPTPTGEKTLGTYLMEDFSKVARSPALQTDENMAKKRDPIGGRSAIGRLGTTE